MSKIRERASRLTQRLDHGVPDPEMPMAFNKQAAQELSTISQKLFELLPDESLSPLERVERLARVIERRTPVLDQLTPAHKKVSAIKARLDELIPGDGSSTNKIDQLVQKLNEIAPRELKNAGAIQKLEAMGDPRGKIEPE